MGARFSSRPSTSESTEYYSARSQAMMRSRDQFSDDVAMEIEFSKPHWSEVQRVNAAPQSAEEEKLNRENKEVMKEVQKEHPSFIHPDLDSFVLGRMIAEGGQAKVYAVRGHSDHYLMKVFKRGTSLRALRDSCPLPVLNKVIRQCILHVGLLKDGRFAFLMERCWGDLRKLIDQAMQEKNVDGIQGPPFPYKWKDFQKWTFHSVDLMYGIATHMRDLHEEGISHRDLKASNVLLQSNCGPYNYFLKESNKGIIVADFECSIGVWGTGFWRAPEILATIENQKTITNEQWKQVDVYSYGMTCFEIVTGRIPFDGELGNTRVDRQLVIEGRRPQLPSDLDDAMKDLITKCWEPNPSSRPTFSEIVDKVETMCTKLCEFRLFGIGDELPPQYHLATVQEVNDYPLALVKAMPRWEMANLANGCVDGFRYGMNTRLKRQSNIGHKLARLHR